MALSWLTLLWIFRHTATGSVSAEERRQIVASFGPCQKSLMERAAAVVDHIKLLAGEDDFNSLLATGRHILSLCYRHQRGKEESVGPRVKHLEALAPRRRCRRDSGGGSLLNMGMHLSKDSWKTVPNFRNLTMRFPQSVFGLRSPGWARSSTPGSR